MIPVARDYNPDDIIWIDPSDWDKYKENGWRHAIDVLLEKEAEWAKKRREIERQIVEKRLEK